MEIKSRREAKKISFILERSSHEKSKEAKKLRNFRKSNKMEDVRQKNWLDIYDEDEDSYELSGFEKITKVTGKYKYENSDRVFSRADPSLGKRKEKAIASNFDQIVIVASVKSPPLKTGLIDRFLLIAEKKGFDVLICINKIDLTYDSSEYMDELAVYKTLGYRVIPVSAVKKTGIEELKEYFKNRRSLFTGHSGVGKSSLLNALDPALKLKTGEVSDSTNKGKHTTTSTRLLKLSFGGEVFDSPGIKQFGISDISKKELPGLFREFKNKINLCKYPDCSHIEEENCAVKEALLSGEICRARYDTYVRIRESLG
ncbi:MAG: ribosome small subunit-dependent GTPase A [Candidatus Eremiobacterota bacterium]